MPNTAGGISNAVMNDIRVSQLVISKTSKGTAVGSL